MAMFRFREASRYWRIANDLGWRPFNSNAFYANAAVTAFELERVVGWTTLCDLASRPTLNSWLIELPIAQQQEVVKILDLS